MLPNYQKQVKEIDNKIHVLNQKDNKLSLLRLLSFLSFSAGLVWAVSLATVFSFLLPLILLLIFIAVLSAHQKTRKSISETHTLKELLENEINVLHFRGNQYYNGNVFVDADHDFSLDMDIFGENSLFQYINRCATGVGNQKLADILRSCHSRESILERQEMVKELATEKDWSLNLRQMLFKKCMKDFSKELLPEIKNTIQPPVHYRYLLVSSYIVLALSLIGIPFLKPGGWMLLIPVFFNMILLSRTGKFIKTSKEKRGGREG
ncbi:MAG: hypothetical protein ACOCWW_01065, partial [Bacteroidota bacterium]